MTNFKNYHNTRFSYNQNREEIWRAIIQRYLQKHIPQDSVVLDLGAGYCTFINNIKAKEKHALDVSEVTRKHADKGVKVHCRSCVNMSIFKTSYFDVIFASNIFEHLPKDDFEKCLAEVRRVLKKGGILIVVQPNFRYAYRKYFDDYTHQIIFTDISLCDLLRSNDFAIIKKIPRFMPFSMESRLLKPLSRLRIPLNLILKIYFTLPIKPFASQMLVIAEKK